MKTSFPYGIYLLIMLMNYRFILGQSILSLFRVNSSTESQITGMSKTTLVIGIAGILCIAAGYYASSQLFSGSFTTLPALLSVMCFILGAVILGTYLFYKGSVQFIFNIVRRQKNGYLAIKDVMSLSTLMFRMKSNAILLTIITTVSALAIGLLSLSYISYYSAEKTAKMYVPADFAILDIQSATAFENRLASAYIAYTDQRTQVIYAHFDLKDVMSLKVNAGTFDISQATIGIIPETAVKGLHLAENETVFTHPTGSMMSMFQMKKSGSVTLTDRKDTITLSYSLLDRDAPISNYYADGGTPIAIVNEVMFQRIQQQADPALQRKHNMDIGINITDRGQVEQANTIYNHMGFADKRGYDSQLNLIQSQKSNMGIIMFIVGFLGLTFLVTSGCILYFKQMDESESEKGSYTILRKIGFTTNDLIRGIGLKQLYNFGIPLVIGLFHSYFAVRSGWFFFGTELWTPMIAVMLLYTALYSIFGILSVYYYRRVIKEAL